MVSWADSHLTSIVMIVVVVNCYVTSVADNCHFPKPPPTITAIEVIISKPNEHNMVSSYDMNHDRYCLSKDHCNRR